MRIALVTDAWAPQVNGVVRTLATTVDHLRRRGIDVTTFTPDAFATVPCPTYPDIRLALGSGRAVAARLDRLAPDAVHIATEGPLGWAARRWCLAAGQPFTTSFHTRFPDYLAARTKLPADIYWPLLVRFHARAESVFVATASLGRELAARGLGRTHRWSRGVDLSLFTPAGETLAELRGLPRPIQLCVGRVAVEKNIAAFLAAPTAGSKVVVGDGPALARLRREHPQVLFTGALRGAALAAAYRTADVLVFPSRTDTFGLVMIEALACGTPVAGFPVRGPLDVIGEDGLGCGGAPIGALDGRLEIAVARALRADRTDCAREAARYDWSHCTAQFLAGLCRRAPALAGTLALAV